jgi:hypothetical protein
MATLISSMVGDTTNGAAAKANRKASGSATASSARRSAVGQRSSVESRFGVRAGNIAKQQAVLRDRGSTPEQRAIATRKLTLNTTIRNQNVGNSFSAVNSRANQARLGSEVLNAINNSLGR